MKFFGIPRKKKHKNHYHNLHQKWSKRYADVSQKLVEKHQDALEFAAKNLSSQQLKAGSLGGLMLLGAPAMGFVPSSPPPASVAVVNDNLDRKIFLISDLQKILPSLMRPLDPSEETKISDILSRKFDLDVKAELSGIRLNRSYGYIGAEQHLARFPGDNMVTHFQSPDDAERFTSSGMAPGLGAWGYFAFSRDKLGEEDVLREKYYIAVQTFLAPGFMEHTREYVNFFKYRKMLVVNPQNGKAIVADIADAGPAEWTGKHLGGSPEVMAYLERVDGMQRGPVLYFFINDPDNKVPLGPIQSAK